MGPKVGYFAGFWHHRLVTMWAHTRAYHYLLFESGMKTGFWTVALCKKDKALLHKHKKQQYNYYLYIGNWCTAGYDNLIIGVL